ncbi:MAG: flagellar FlbD family protein [Acidobacteriaceae bacterium]
MIQLTRLNGEGMVLNSDLVRYAEANPDTVITLVTGEKIVVSETCAEVIARVIEYRAGLLRTAFPHSNAVEEGLSTRETALNAKVASTAVESVRARFVADPDADKSWRRRRRDSD